MKTKIIPFKETFLTLSHYKEPLKALNKKEGFGYYGALLSTIEGRFLQCHICGELFSELQAHVRQAHHLSADEYREKYDLAQQTALVSEFERDRRKQRTLLWQSKMTRNERINIKKKAREKYAEWRAKHPTQPSFKIRLETKNKRGTCPDQLLAKIKEVADELGEVPSKHQFILATGTQRYVHLIYKTFGSWSKALNMLGMQAKNKSSKGTKKQICSDEELIEYLQIFFQEEGKIPTATDCRRGLIPDYEIYKRRFGSLPIARMIAGIEDVPTRWGNK